jgi:hypothetical protein
MAESKALNPAPVEIELTDTDGKKKKFTGVILTRKNFLEISEREKEIGKIKTIDRVYEFMALYFGGIADDYTDYDFRAVRAAVDLFTKDLQNPTI